MRKLRKAAVVAAVVGSVSMIGAGAAAACGEEHPPEKPSVSIECSQDTGDNTNTNQEAAAGDIAANVSDALNGGDASADANQQICGLENENIQNEAGTAEGGEGGEVGDIEIGD